MRNLWNIIFFVFTDIALKNKKQKPYRNWRENVVMKM